MTEPSRTVPEPPRLDAAAVHSAAAEHAAARGDFDTALRERFRAVLRGLEQRGLLEVRRSRTARETSHEAASLSARDFGELSSAARSFDEVVYGGRRADEEEYRRLTQADLFSAAAPPPAAEPIDIEPAGRGSRWRPGSGEWPAILRQPRFWAGLAALVLLLLVLYAVLQGCSGPSAPRAPDAPPTEPPPIDPPSGDYDPDLPRPTGDDSLFGRTPDRLAYGGLQFLIAAALLVWWRARRRGTVVGEPRPVEVAADELLAGQAGLYRRSGDHAHIAGVLRAATERRLRRALGTGTSPEELTAAVAARIGADPALVGSALYGPVPDASALQLVVAQLEWIEAEVR